MSRQRPTLRTVKETAKRLNLGLSTTYRAIAAKEIKAVKIGGALRVSDVEIDRIVHGQAAT
jgi:excisionase family DNA binding protein